MEQEARQEKLNWWELAGGAFGAGGFGIIVSAALDRSGWLPFKLPHLAVAFLFALFFLAGQLWVPRANASPKLRRAYKRALLVVAVLTILAIPVMWWAIIQKMAASGGRGM